MSAPRPSTCIAGSHTQQHEMQYGHDLLIVIFASSFYDVLAFMDNLGLWITWMRQLPLVVVFLMTSKTISKTGL